MKEKPNIKAIRFKFFDSDFCSAALGAVKALHLILDLTIEPEEIILNEFKFLIHHLANVNSRAGKSGHHEVPTEYFSKCTVEKLTYVPKKWFNAESIIYDIEKKEVTTL